jgi:hypothetical protein
MQDRQRPLPGTSDCLGAMCDDAFVEPRHPPLRAGGMPFAGADRRGREGRHPITVRLTIMCHPLMPPTNAQQRGMTVSSRDRSESAPRDVCAPRHQPLSASAARSRSGGLA